MEDVREYIAKFVINNRISMYKLYKTLGEEGPKESIIESIFNLCTKDNLMAYYQSWFNNSESKQENSTVKGSEPETKDSDNESVPEETDNKESGNLSEPILAQTQIPASSHINEKRCISDPCLKKNVSKAYNVSEVLNLCSYIDEE